MHIAISFLMPKTPILLRTGVFLYTEKSKKEKKTSK